MLPHLPILPLITTILSLTTHLSSALSINPRQNANDPCGPSIAVPGIGNTCDGPLPINSTPSIFGVTCSNTSTPGPLIYASTCTSLITAVCGTLSTVPPVWQQSLWNWATNGRCSMGFWIPKPYVLADGVTVDWAAKFPTVQKCEEVYFTAMLSACTQPGEQWSTASVNLAKMPGEGGTGLPVEGGTSYPSFIITAGALPKTPTEPLH